MKFCNYEAQKNDTKSVYIFAFFICLLQPMVLKKCYINKE